MRVWIVDLTLRDANGDRTKEPYGAFTLDELPGVLEHALRRAEEERGGVQVVRRLEGAQPW